MAYLTIFLVTLKGLMLHCVQWSGRGICVATDDIPALQDSCWTLKNPVYRALFIACNPLQPGSPEEKKLYPGQTTCGSMHSYWPVLQH